MLADSSVLYLSPEQHYLTARKLMRLSHFLSADNMANPKAIKLLGSCHCKAVRYSLMSTTPAPYCVCYCGVCRKLNGGNGACVSLTGDAKSFQAEGTQHMGIYRVRIFNRYMLIKLPAPLTQKMSSSIPLYNATFCPCPYVP